MITKFEQYNQPKVGDYVICEDNSKINIISNASLNNFLHSSIGVITRIRDDWESRNFPYVVKYKEIPDYIRNRFHSREREFKLEEILHWSNNEKDLEIYIDVNKYNL
jgi:hypothetical protein